METGYFSTIVSTFSWAGKEENSGEGKKKEKVEKGSNFNNIKYIEMCRTERDGDMHQPACPS